MFHFLREVGKLTLVAVMFNQESACVGITIQTQILLGSLKTNQGQKSDKTLLGSISFSQVVTHSNSSSGYNGL